MFGKHWAPAQGTVVHVRATHTTQAGFVSNSEFVVDVRTPEGVAFRARVPEPRIATSFAAPRIGQLVRVEFDERSHAVRFDRSDPRLRLPKARRSRSVDVDEVLRRNPR